jgi:hypothetical protein
LGRDRGQFQTEERLSSYVLRDLHDILPPREQLAEFPPSRLRHTAERLFGREAALRRLDDAWADPHRHVVVIRNWGGIGKTSLVAEWIAEMALKDWRGAERFFDWTFYSQGTRREGEGANRSASADQFIAAALEFFGDPDPTLGSPWDRGARLAGLVARSKCLLVLDGVEPLQQPPGPLAGQLTDPALTALLKGLAQRNAGLCIVTTRERIPDLAGHYGKTADDWLLDSLTDEAPPRSKAASSRRTPKFATTSLSGPRRRWSG